MAKIPKNRQDTEMIGSLIEQASFEHLSDGDTSSQPVAKPAKIEPAKLKLYKEGIVDYAIKVSCEANQVVLKAVPLNKKPKQR